MKPMTHKQRRAQAAKKRQAQKEQHVQYVSKLYEGLGRAQRKAMLRHHLREEAK